MLYKQSRLNDKLPSELLVTDKSVNRLLISLRLGFRRNFLSVLHPNLVSRPIKGILEILNLTPPVHSDGYFGMDGLCNIS